MLHKVSETSNHTHIYGETVINHEPERRIETKATYQHAVQILKERFLLLMHHFMQLDLCKKSFLCCTRVSVMRL